MTTSMMDDTFGHHVWATRRLLDACLSLSPDQLAMAVPGTYGSILQTARHLVGDDAWDLFVITGQRDLLVDEDRAGLAELDAAMARNGEGWLRVLAGDLDPDAVLVEIDENDGFRRDASLGIWLAQALDHGTDHRSQICTALTLLGVRPPAIDAFQFGLVAGRNVETPPAT